MKSLLTICGPNGVGKTTACKEVLKKLPKTAYLDAEWMRQMNPFALTDETIPLIANNCTQVLHNYLDSSSVEYVLFSYGFHGRRNEIWERIQKNMREREIYFDVLVLTCAPGENIRRMKEDKREEARIKRAMLSSREIYEKTDYPILDTTFLQPKQVAEKIIERLTNLEREKRME